MKFIAVWFSAFLFAFSSFAVGQQPSGPFPQFPSPNENEVWYGTIEQPQQHLRILFSWKKKRTDVEEAW